MLTGQYVRGNYAGVIGERQKMTGEKVASFVGPAFLRH